MKQNIKPLHIALFSTAMLAGSATVQVQAQAQTQPNDSTLNRTVVVENEYDPQIMDANKINLLPDIEEPQPTRKEIVYAQTVHPFSAFRYRAMPSYAPKPVQPDSPHSYINLGYGNNGNVTGEMNYLFDFSPADRFNVNAAFDGFNFDPDRTEELEGWKSRFYQTQIKADYAHRFRSAELGVSGSFSSQVFNYLPLSLYATDKQRNMLGGVQLHVRSTDPSRAWQYALEAGVNYFGRGYLYGADESNSETSLRLKGGLSYSADGTNRVGLDLDVNQANYSFEGLENNGLIGLTPYYNYTTDAMRLRVGARVDIRTGYDNGVAFAPDVKAEFPLADHYVLYVQATGGTLLNDFFRFNSITPYWGGYAGYDQLKNTRVQLDAQAGFKADMGENLWMNLYAGYELRKNEIGFYPYSTDDIELLPYSFMQGKGNNLKAGFASAYQYKDIIDVSFSVDYRKWSTDDGRETVLYDKPKLDAHFDMQIHPTSRLNINLGYQYRNYAEGNRNAVSDLYAGADYRLFNFFTLWVKAANLTNSEYEYDLNYPAQGIHFMVGTSFRF